MFTVDLNLIGLRKGDSFLDVGCGNGRHSWGTYKLHDCTVCALDIGQEDLQRTRYTLTTIEKDENRSGKWLAIRGDAANLPFPDASFDKVVCSEVLEHLRDDRRGIAELVRVLKDDGVLAVSVPNFLPESIYWRISKDYHSKPGGHVRIYRRKHLLQLLQEHDLDILTIRYKHSLHSPYWLLRCLFGINNEGARIPALYHKFLVWDLKTKHKAVRLLDSLLNRIIPKSIVIYAKKGDDVRSRSASP